MVRTTRGAPRGWLGRLPDARRPILGLHVGARPAADPPDPLEAPRTVRRALADAGLKATEVGRLACTEAVAAGDARAFARRALGATGETVALSGSSEGGALSAALGSPEDIVVAVDAPGGVPFALCLGPPGPDTAI